LELGLTEPVGTGPETVGTGRGPDRFPSGPNSKFEFELKNEKISQNSPKYFKVCAI
jgi:hypothetical protein